MAEVSRFAEGREMISARAHDILRWKVASCDADNDFLALAEGYVGSETTSTVGIVDDSV